MTSDEAGALMALFQMQERLNDTFQRTILTQLLISVPQFDVQALLDTLYFDQASLPTPADTQNPNEQELRRRAIATWKRKIDLTEEAMRDAQGILERIAKSKS